MDHDVEDNLTCGYDGCEKHYPNIKSLKNHFYRIHSGLNLDFSNLFNNLLPQSFFYKFLENPSSINVPQNLVEIDNLSFNNSPTLHIPEPIDYAAVKGLAKIAFEFMHVRSLCKSNQAIFFSEILKYIANNNISSHVIKYASEVFLKEECIHNYFKTNFIHFVLQTKEINGENIYYTDISFILKQVFDKTSILNHLVFQKSSSCLLSFLDGSSGPSSCNIISLAVYFDDFNPLLNSLGTASSNYNVTSVYIKILNLNPLFQSKRDFILLLACFYSKNCKDSELKPLIYNFLSSQLNNLLSSGVEGYNYHFNIHFFVGDNLASNEICGMVKSFKSSHYCRFCLMSSEECNEIFSEDINLLRGLSHNRNLFTLNQIKPKNKQISHVYGVKGPNLLKSLINFESDSSCFLSCISHDLFEGIVPRLIESTLGRLIRDKILKERFDDLVGLLMSFKLNSKDSSSRFYISNGISCSSSQGRTLAKIFLFALRNKIPSDCFLCKGLVHLNNIINMVSAPFFFKSSFPILENEIFSLLKFVRCDLNLNIYPKLHFLTHYPTQIKKYGPMRYYCTDIFESTHKKMKRHILTSSNHKDVIKSMFNGLLGEISFDFFCNTLFEVKFVAKKSSHVSFQDLDFNVQSKFSPTDKISSSKSLSINNIKFKSGYFLYNSSSKQYTYFSKINEIYSSPSKFVLCCQLYTFKHLLNLNCYELVELYSEENFVLDISLEKFIDPLESYHDSGKIFLIPSYRYFE